MWVYWFLALMPLIGVFSPARLTPKSRGVVWLFVAIFLVAFVGLRDVTGGDWYPYERSYWELSQLSVGELFARTRDPGYYWSGWLLSKLGLTVHALNFVCATVLVAGLVRFCRAHSYPWVALFVAIPYLVIVVGMGYVRQSAAIGFVLLALVALGTGNVRRYLILILMASLFHRTAIVLLPLAAVVASRNRWWTIFWVGLMSIIGYYAFVVDNAETLWETYVGSDFSEAASGAPLRVAMNAMPAAVFLVLLRKRTHDVQLRKLWTTLSVAGLICVPLLQLSYTAVDRMALYLMPLQLYVASELITSVHGAIAKTNIALLYSAMYLGVMFVWLNYAETSAGWIPYKNILISWL